MSLTLVMLNNNIQNNLNELTLGLQFFIFFDNISFFVVLKVKGKLTKFGFNENFKELINFILSYLEIIHQRTPCIKNFIYLEDYCIF